MADRHDINSDQPQQFLRRLAEEGDLATTFASCFGEDRIALREAAYSIAWPIVFSRLTRQIERRRGHLDCSKSVRHLSDGCLDAFHDDVEASVEDMLLRATVPIANLEAWIASRLKAATVDAHRRRRGSRGALQRPRPPKWLTSALGHDPWLVELATQMLVWVGLEAVAGHSIWPIDSWVAQRAVVTMDSTGSTVTVLGRDIDTVLAAMRRRPDWYQKYLERPLGRKQSGIGMGPYIGEDGHIDHAVPLVSPAEADDGRLRDLAASALEAIEARITAGDDVTLAVKEVVERVFRGAGHDDIDRPPFADDQIRQASTLLGDPAVVERVTAAILDIIGVPGA